jgi:hypothetical protein
MSIKYFSPGIHNTFAVIYSDRFETEVICDNEHFNFNIQYKRKSDKFNDLGFFFSINKEHAHTFIQELMRENQFRGIPCTVNGSSIPDTVDLYMSKLGLNIQHMSTNNFYLFVPREHIIDVFTLLCRHYLPTMDLTEYHYGIKQRLTDIYH